MSVRAGCPRRRVASDCEEMWKKKLTLSPPDTEKHATNTKGMRGEDAAGNGKPRRHGMRRKVHRRGKPKAPNGREMHRRGKPRHGMRREMHSRGGSP